MFTGAARTAVLVKRAKTTNLEKNMLEFVFEVVVSGPSYCFQ